MNLFQKYGIKEVADVVFYSITTVGDEIVYTPVLYLDTLKVSTIEKSAEKVTAEGGKGNKKLISWNFGKEFTLNLEDALFTPASMSLIWGGKLNAKLSPYMSAIVKMNAANKYGNFHYSTKAYPSPALTEEEWDIVFRAATETKTPYVDGQSSWYIITPAAKSDESQKAYIVENQVEFQRKYLQRTWDINTDEESTLYNPDGQYNAMPKIVIEKVLTYIDELKKISTIEANSHDIEVVDRFEKCIVRDKEGLVISTDEQKKNLFRYYQDDKTSSYVIYYDAKTMLPLLHIEDGKIKGWEHEHDSEGVDQGDTEFVLKLGTIYYKWSRTVKYKEGEDTTLGKVLVIDAETFPGDYKITGETWVREQKTGKDQRCQFVINRAQVSTDTSITLEADGEPTTFSMSVDVLSPPNGDMIEIQQFNIDEDILHGGTRITPQKASYTHTNTEIKEEQIDSAGIYNGEII